MKNIANFYPLIFRSGLFLSVASLPFSKFTLSLGILLLTAGFVLSGYFSDEFPRFLKHRVLMFGLLFYLVNVLWMLNTTDVAFGLKHLRIKLPMLLLPVIMAFSPPVSQSELRRILLVFVSAVILSTVMGTIYFPGLIRNAADSRQFSPFISHIRFSMMILFSVCILWYYGFQSDTGPKQRLLFFVLSIWLIFYLLVLKTLTGLVMLPLLVLLMLTVVAVRLKWPKKIFALTAMAMVVLICVMAVKSGLKRYFTDNDQYNTQLLTCTANGNPYDVPLNRQKENGNYVWFFVSEKELSTAWARRSTWPYNGTDARGQQLRMTLIRYLASKALTKDSAGLAQLTDKDILHIESGITNYLFTSPFSLYAKFYETVWQIEQYTRNRVPEGHSLTMRWVYWQIGWYIAARHLLTGVGTGDLQMEFDRYYSQHFPDIQPENKLRAQNQYLTFLIAFGLAGFILEMLSLLLPVVMTKKYQHLLFLAFFFISGLSMLYEDTFETHTGLCFFALFYSLFVYGYRENNR